MIPKKHINNTAGGVWTPPCGELQIKEEKKPIKKTRDLKNIPFTS